MSIVLQIKYLGTRNIWYALLLPYVDSNDGLMLQATNGHVEMKETEKFLPTNGVRDKNRTGK